jgi:hypothetical protein
MTNRKRPRPESITAFWRAVVGDPPGDKDLWQRVDYWRERLRDCDNYPSLAGLESSWQLLVSYYGEDFGRAEKPRPADTPLAALFYCIEMGFYPPPELMLALMDAYDVYKASRGDLSLEEVFFGPPRRKAGGYARRKAEQMQRLFWGMDIDSLMRKGHAKMKAAELVAEKYRGMYEPETIARRALLPRFKRPPRPKK